MQCHHTYLRDVCQVGPQGAQHHRGAWEENNDTVLARDACPLSTTTLALIIQGSGGQCSGPHSWLTLLLR